MFIVPVRFKQKTSPKGFKHSSDIYLFIPFQELLGIQDKVISNCDLSRRMQVIILSLR